jgi:hypothetical protein
MDRKDKHIAFYNHRERRMPVVLLILGKGVLKEMEPLSKARTA